MAIQHFCSKAFYKCLYLHQLILPVNMICTDAALFILDKNFIQANYKQAGLFAHLGIVLTNLTINKIADILQLVFSVEIALSWQRICIFFIWILLKCLIDKSSSLIQVMALCHQATSHYLKYGISQEICTWFLLCCALLWLYIDWFSHIHQAYFTGTVAI